MQKAITEFSTKSNFELKLFIVNNLTQSEKERASTYNKKFYASFTNFLYNDKKYFDNYVGLIIKCLRSFFNYLEKERSISVGTYRSAGFAILREIIFFNSSTHLDFNNRRIANPAEQRTCEAARTF